MGSRPWYSLFAAMDTRIEAIEVAKFHGGAISGFGSLLMILSALSSNRLVFLYSCLCLLAGCLVRRWNSRMGALISVGVAVALTATVTFNLMSKEADRGLAPVIAFWIIAVRATLSTFKLHGRLRETT